MIIALKFEYSKSITFKYELDLAAYKGTKHFKAMDKGLRMAMKTFTFTK